MRTAAADPLSVLVRAGLAVVVAVLIAVALLGGYFAGHRRPASMMPATDGRALADFRLVDALNRSVTAADVRGRVLVVSFVFTACSASCLQVSHNMSRIQQAFGGVDDVRLLSISVDPRDDTPEALRAFGRKFGADPQRWMFLTGEPAEVHGLLRKSFLSVDASGTYNPMPGGYVDADRIAVVGVDGKLIGFVPGTKAECVDTVISQVQRLRLARRGS